MVALPVERHLLRARDLADRAYAEQIGVADMAHAAGLSQAHFARAFKAAFGIAPHGYLLTRRLERAAALLRDTDDRVADICMRVGLTGVGSFTTSFTRMFGMRPTEYRARYATSWAHRLPGCILRHHARPQLRSFREALPVARD